MRMSSGRRSTLNITIFKEIFLITKLIRFLHEIRASYPGLKLCLKCLASFQITKNNFHKNAENINYISTCITHQWAITNYTLSMSPTIKCSVTCRAEIYSSNFIKLLKL